MGFWGYVIEISHVETVELCALLEKRVYKIENKKF